MNTLLQALEVFSILGTYGGVGAMAGIAMYRVLVTRGNAPGSENLGPAALMAGVFWPIGLWVAVAMYFTGDHLSLADQRQIRKRQNAVLKDMQMLQVAGDELKVEKARVMLELEQDQFHSDRMRAINARKLDD